MPRAPRHPTSIVLTPQLKRRLTKQAKRLGHRLAPFIVYWLEQRVAEEEAKQAAEKRGKS